MPKPIATCVLGVGLSGLTFHVPFLLALSDLFTLQSVLERNPTQEGGSVKQRFGASVKIHRSFEAVIADPEIELIVIGTPNETHYDFAKAALLAGKHVLVDKPVTPTSVQARELYDIARSKNLVLYAYQNRRWDSDFLALRKLLALPETSAQSIGTIIEFESHFDRYRTVLKGTWKDEARPAAGLTYDLGAHLIDQALALFGRPDKITGFIQNLRGLGNPAVDDWFTIHLHYLTNSARPYPLTAILRANILSARSSQLRYLVRGTRGSYIKYGVDVQEDQLKVIHAPGAILESHYGKEPDSLWGTVENLQGDGASFNRATWPSEDAGCYTDLFRNLAAAIREGTDLLVPWKDAQTVIELIELAQKSANEGKTVDVPPV
ncbi:NAD(P)-binding protein [Macrolepiota fuliginosa MF-IS2]|uniref:NAD(P)-binding protein n=1 Tax=Macrolepiota fuliginosa MF-IS2 TaxID=1400762 RepID=A0A9P5XIN2_9AGAR|nr:NAD(P)-binding protein [Macrolepiota fuliginosa MF-IS2]